MQYRQLGRTKLVVSAIGLGTEYLLDLPQQSVVAVVHEATKQGINYFDMFGPQPTFRDNVGTALKGYREEAILAAHLGAVEQGGQYAKSREPQLCRQFFLDFLQRLGTNYVDVLFLHNCDDLEDYNKVMLSGKLLEMAHRFQQEGKARFIGFSCHNIVTALQAIESQEIDVLMFPVNLANHALPGRDKVLNACMTHNVGLVAMKPFAGGSLLREKGMIYIEDFQMGRREMPGAPTRFNKTMTITPVHCLSYILSQPGISTIVPGCKSVDEVTAAIGHEKATEKERDYAPLLAGFKDFANGECVYCNHCLPCPSEINIGQVLNLFEQARQSLTDELGASYRALTAKASDCIQCNACSERCPFGLDVAAKMLEAARLFE